MICSYEQALNIILSHTTPLDAEEVDLVRLAGRVAAEDIKAPWDLPRWDNSEMDGFAVRTADCRPFVCLRVVDYLPAGASAEGIVLKHGSAVRIMTGAPIPLGCDAVVPLEHTQFDQGSVTLNHRVGLGDFIRFRGSDMAMGELMIRSGTVLRPADVNLLASFSLLRLKVYRRPRVAILSTGDELVPPAAVPGPGQVIDGNAYSLAAAVEELGGKAQLLGIAGDDPVSLREKIRTGLHADVLITSAGVSSGDRDLVRDVLAEFGVEQLFWRVNIKPSGPTAFGRKDKTLIFSLPGNPVSSLLGFVHLVRPALLKQMGHTQVLPLPVRARLTGSLHNESQKLRFLRVKVMRTSQGFTAESAGNQNTGILSTMIRANGIVALPSACSELSPGAEVDVYLLRPEEFSAAEFQGPEDA